LAQSWSNKELVIITGQAHHPLQAWVSALATPLVHCICAGAHGTATPSLGALYNQAIAMTRGLYVAIWDATARHAPGWLAGCLSALQKQGADVIWHTNLLVWRPHLHCMVRWSGPPWMMSMVAKRRSLPAFADQDSILNDPLQGLLINRGRAISLSDSNLYIHVEGDTKDGLVADCRTLEQTQGQVVHEGMDYQLAMGQLNTLLPLVDEAPWAQQLQAPPHRQNVTCQRFSPGNPQPSVVRLPTIDLLEQHPSNLAMVSCLMVSRGDVARAKFGVMSYLQQTWPNKELVVVIQQEQTSLANWLATLDEPSIRLHIAPSHWTLGDLRNASIAHAQGEFIMQWDDDDLSDPDRIRAFMGAAKRLQVDLVFLSRWFHWWPARRSFCGAVHRIWEGSMLARKSCMVRYPSLPKGEDTDVMQQLVSQHPFALVDWPELYVYTVTGKNTWDTSFFERHWQQATWRAQGLVYDDLLDALNRRLPIKAYAAALSEEQAPPRWTRVVQYVATLHEGDGVSQSVTFMDALLKQAGFETDIFVGCLGTAPDGLPRNEQGKVIPLADNGQTLLLVHFSLGDGYLVRLMQVYSGAVGMYFHNMTPPSLLPPRTDNPLLHELYALGMEQLRQYKNRYCVVMANSRYSANELTRSYQYRDVSVLPALVDTDQWNGNAPKSLTAVNQLVGIPFVLQVSRLMPHKNQLASIAVLNTLRKQHGSDMQLVLVGDTSEAAYVQLLRHEVQAQGLDDVVHILGKVKHEELAWLYQHAKAYLCMSEHEGFGMPLLEAAMAGCPIVALDNSAKHEVVGGNGTLVSPQPLDDQAARVAAAVYQACRKPALSTPPSAITDRYARATLVTQLTAILRSA
jgi:Glycosyl transferases group 1/Glycosyl transferase family 2